jgi:CheY-like chemotaxis protein
MVNEIKKEKTVKSKKTVLIMEDETSLRTALIDALHRKNFNPLSAKNGKEGLRIALKEHPHLILLDLIMEEMDGMSALKKIRQDAWGATVPIIILTNLSTLNVNMIDRAPTHPPTEYLIKSDWKLYDVVKRIEKALR